METKKLYRSCKNQIIGGVAGGLAEYLGVDPIWVRLVFLVLLFSGIGLAAYIIAWIIIPIDPSCKTAKTGSEEIKEKSEAVANEFRNGGSKDNSLRLTVGAIILAFGIILLFESFVGIYIWKVFWPAVLILIGFYFITKAGEK